VLIEEDKGMERRSVFSVLVTLVTVLALATTLPAQTRTGSVSGTVKDATGQVVPGASVTLTGQTLVAPEVTTSNEVGAYRFLNLPPGDYALKVELSGFKTLNREGVRVDIGKNTAIDIPVELATVAETVTVTGESPMVDTKSTVVGVNFDEELLQNVPSAKDIWSILEHQAPGVTTNRLDVGGSETGLQATFSARGTAWQQNSYYLNGINVTCPAALGASGYYYDFDSFEEVQVETGSHPASVNAPGLFLNMVTKTGGNTFKGGASYYYESDETQGDNIDDELRARGAGRGTSFDYLSDANAQIGGPILKDRSTFYFSWRDERVHRFVAGFPEVEATDMWQFLIKNSTRLNDKNKVGIEWHHMSYYKPNRDASSTRAPEATWIEDDTFDIVQAEWQATVNENTLLDTRFSHLKVFFPTYLQPDAVKQSAFDQVTSFTSNAHTMGVERDRRRYAFKSDLTYFRSNWASANHEFKFGFEYSHSPIENLNESIGDVELRLRSGVADQVRLRNTPFIDRQAMDQVSFFVDDIINIGSRFTLKVGVRMDHYNGYLPEQNSPAGTWVGERSFPERTGLIDLTSFAPRVGAVIGIEEGGKSALKLSWGRYYHQFTTGFPNFANQNASLFDAYTWNDLNGDLQFQNGEQGTLLSRGIGPTNLIDPDFKNPYTDEFTAGIDKEIGKDFAVTATFAYRKGNNLHESVDVGIPFSAYSPVTVTDPGPDGRVGTADDGGPFQVFNMDISYRGRQQRQLTNPQGNDSTYKGFEVSFQKRLSDKWQGLLSYSYNNTEAWVPAGNNLTENQVAAGPGTFFETPNGLINARGKPFWDRTNQLKALGSYFAPYGIRISGVLRYQTGQPYARWFTVSGLNQGTITVAAEPAGSQRLPSVTTADLTFAKQFNVGKGRLEGSFDIFNIANANYVTSINSGSGSAYNRVLNFLSPRVFRFGVRYNF